MKIKAIQLTIEPWERALQDDPQLLKATLRVRGDGLVASHNVVNIPSDDLVSYFDTLLQVLGERLKDYIQNHTEVDCAKEIDPH
jgi:hypothetical protein